MRLVGKVALISGGARGMGAAEARLFAREGAQVVIGDILATEGGALEADIRAKGGEAVFAAMRRAGGGSIVNISSQLGLVGTDNSSPQYQASKGAVRLLTKATAIQYAREGIRANSVHPGPIVTPMTEARRADPEIAKLMVSRIPLGRYGETE